MHIPYFDAHCDTIQFVTPDGVEPSSRLYDYSGHINLARLSHFRPCGQFFALFGGPDNSPDNKLSEFDRQLAVFFSEMRQNDSIIVHCKNSSDMSEAFADGKIAAFLSVEGAELIGCNVDGLENAYQAGVRSVMPVWNHSNVLCGSNAENPDVGLSGAGVEFVKYAYKRKFLIDVSHMSDKGFYDVYALALKFNMPVIASHSNSRSVCPHKRNLTDDMFKKIIQTGGFAGINLYSAFLSENQECRISDIIAHTDKFISLGGANNICLGCDFDGCDSLPVGIDSVSDLEKLYYCMLLHGYSKKTVCKIFGKNLIRIISTVV